MLTKHISTNTESLKPCFTAYPVQHKNKSENYYVQNTVTNELLIPRNLFFFQQQRIARPFTFFTEHRGTA